VEATLLVELLTEELPPKSLRALGDAFADQLVAEIVRYRLKDRVPGKRTFATPRRLAVLIPEVREKALDLEHAVEGPASSNKKAVEGFAKKHRVAPESLERRQTEKGEIVVARFRMPGVQLDAVLADIVEKAIGKLPVSKLMRWGEGEAQFVRPVHGLVMLHGTREIPGTVLGVAASSTTRGHRFMGARSIALKNADEYEARLRDDGMVIADFAARRAAIEQQLAAEAEHQGALLGDHEGLLDEVTALVEHPAVYAGAFDPAFLALPQECLILTMRQNQKYFPLFDAAGKLLPTFLIVSNVRVSDPRHIVSGNERVVRPRLEDARFFYEQDRKIRLEARVPQLAKVVYHNKLGTQLERVERLQLLAGRIARELKADAALAERAAWLSKADLLTGMVGEFPELQGTMGRYYALYDGESREVAHAIEAHYRPRFAGDGLPAGDVARIVALADKLDALVGMFSIGGAPTGEKDPFGLRRAVLGVLRILIEAKLPLELPALLVAAAGGFTNGQVPDHVRTEVYDFALERLRHYLREQGYAADEIESVVSQAPQRIDLVTAKLDAVRTFRQMPEAGSLAEANKRIRNILRKSEATYARLDASLLREKEERDLYKFMQDINQRIALFVRQGDYTATLTATATVQPSVAAFFDKVMVNAEDAKLRANRHALLKELGDVLNQVADISKLAQ